MQAKFVPLEICLEGSMVETGQMDLRCPVNTSRLSVVSLLALLQRLDLPKLFPATIQRRLTEGVTTLMTWTAQAAIQAELTRDMSPSAQRASADCLVLCVRLAQQQLGAWRLAQVVLGCERRLGLLSGAQDCVQ